jgi:hypothetical protein
MTSNLDIIHVGGHHHLATANTLIDARSGTARNDMNRPDIRVGKRSLENAIASGAAGAEDGDGVQAAWRNCGERGDLTVVRQVDDDAKHIESGEKTDGNQKQRF